MPKTVIKPLKQWLLVTETKYFVDGHGTFDEGGTKKFLTKDQSYLNCKRDRYYSDIPLDPEDSSECEVKKDDAQSNDGYNLEVSSYKVKKIHEVDLISVKNIIRMYNRL